MRAVLTIAPLALAGCAGIQSSNGRDGAHGALIARLGEGFLWTTVAVYVLVLALLALAVRHGRRNLRANAIADERTERQWRFWLIAFAAGTAAILLALSTATWLTDRALAVESRDPALEIEIIGHQWWWEVRYQNRDPSRIVRTANELHLPSGRTAHVKLVSNDVIHSFWVPNLAGKQDLIPGREVDIALKPLHVGEYRSQCAEFCGIQHANMALTVTVEAPAAFAAWYEAGLAKPTMPPAGPAAAGFALFQTRQCGSCHTVAGTSASGMVAPDLSHLASRKTLAAGALPMTHDALVRWIGDPQAVKPGNYMPKVPLSPAELEQVVAYLETLK